MTTRTPVVPAIADRRGSVRRLRGIEVVLGAGVILFLMILVTIGAVVLRSELVNRRFLKLAPGMSANVVVDVMGRPSAVERCTGREALLDTSERPCAEQYIYRSFLGRWIIGVDSGRRVVFLHQYVSE